MRIKSLLPANDGESMVVGLLKMKVNNFRFFKD